MPVLIEEFRDKCSFGVSVRISVWTVRLHLEWRVLWPCFPIIRRGEVSYPDVSEKLRAYQQYVRRRRADMCRCAWSGVLRSFLGVEDTLAIPFPQGHSLLGRS